MSQLPNERALIEHLRARLPPAPSTLLVGPGDDAAVVRPGRGTFQVLTTDALIEGIHFDRRWSSLADVGYRALAVNVSDLAAMGAHPTVALLSLALPEWVKPEDLDALLDGFLESAATERVTLAGGNLSRSPGPLMVDVTAVGEVRPRRMLTRSGGRPGDGIYVTGALGAAAAGLQMLRAGIETTAESLECVSRHRRPTPRTRIGTLLGRNRAASACMDLSDGLADAVRQVAQASGTGASIEADRLPIDPGARRWFDARAADPVLAAVSGGDDFELLFTVPHKVRGRLRAVQRGSQGVPLTRIGELTAVGDVQLVKGGHAVPMPDGFSHF